MTLLVLDGNSIINRAFYGIKLLTTKNGDYTNAVYGFLNMMLRFEDICKPDAVAVAFDLHAPTFRHKMYDAYKAGRHAMPDELRSQLPVVKNLLKLLGIKVLECEGWEADDILGTLAEACRERAIPAISQQATETVYNLLTTVLKSSSQELNRPMLWTRKPLLKLME